MKRTCLSLLFLFFFFSISAQSWDEVKGNSGQYLYGEGWGSSVEEADRQALAALASKVAVVVSFRYEQTERQTGIEEDEYHNKVENRIKAFSSITLTNSYYEILSKKPEVHVARWIEKSELKRIFRGREKKLYSYMEYAAEAEREGMVGDALKYYYWAYSFLTSIQYPEQFTFRDSTGKERLLVTWIPQRMNRMFDEIEVSFSERKEDDIELNFTFGGKLAENIDFSFYDGKVWSQMQEVTDGKGLLHIPRNIYTDKILIRYEYRYVDEASTDDELYDVIEATSGNFSLAEVAVSLPVSDSLVANLLDADTLADSLPEQAALVASTPEVPVSDATDTVESKRGSGIGYLLRLVQKDRQSSVRKDLKLGFTTKNLLQRKYHLFGDLSLSSGFRNLDLGGNAGFYRNRIVVEIYGRIGLISAVANPYESGTERKYNFNALFTGTNVGYALYMRDQLIVAPQIGFLNTVVKGGLAKYDEKGRQKSCNAKSIALGIRGSWFLTKWIEVNFVPQYLMRFSESELYKPLREVSKPADTWSNGFSVTMSIGVFL